MNKPVVLSDLDDTLFQTRRKMVDELALEPFRTGAVDRTLNPRSFMTEEQSMLVDWLLEQAELIPVTARGTEEISRVRIPFHSWAITTHGAVILTPEGKPDEEWKAHMLGQLAPYQEKLTSMQRLITEMMDAKGINAWARLNFEYGETAVYMVMFMPFRDVIISDGLVMPYNILIGGGMKRRFKDSYMAAKKNGQIHRSL